jgi:hypothetical protein
MVVQLLKCAPLDAAHTRLFEPLQTHLCADFVVAAQMALKRSKDDRHSVWLAFGTYQSARDFAPGECIFAVRDGGFIYNPYMLSVAKLT